MDDKPILTVELLRQLLTYNPETGELFWKERGPEWFNIKSRDSRPGWNTQWAGQPALNCRQGSGYRNGHILGHGMQAHRAAYAIQSGVELSDTLVIDHINGVKHDNRFANLRLVTRQQNNRNAKLYSSNKTGVPGVFWEPSHKAWAAKINFDGKQRRIGRFKCFGKALRTRKEAEREYGYHPNHGRAQKP